MTAQANPYQQRATSTQPNLMTALEITTANELQAYLLQGTSRTFALTIPQLPPALRAVVSNAYLLCRIVDTIEDEPRLSPAQKRYFGEQFIAVVAGEFPAEPFATELAPLLSDSTLPEERELVRYTPDVIRITQSFTEPQREALHSCVAVMGAGMVEFQEAPPACGLANLAELDRYCYHVAGVVGVMLTKLFCEYSPAIAQHREVLMSLAVSFGQGLQMTNILKDLWDDKARDACWLPQDVFVAAGFDLKNLKPDSYDEHFGAGLGQLIGIAHGHLKNALSYTLLIPKHEPGIRQFCLWAIGMALLTLRKINRHRDFNTGQQVKISRRSVKATIIASRLAVSNDVMLRSLFRVAAMPLPGNNLPSQVIQS